MTNTAIQTLISQLGPNTGAWVPQSDFPGAKIYPPGSTVILRRTAGRSACPAQGFLCGTAIWCLSRINPYGPLGPPTQTYPQGGH